MNLSIRFHLFPNWPRGLCTERQPINMFSAPDKRSRPYLCLAVPLRGNTSQRPMEVFNFHPCTFLHLQSFEGLGSICPPLPKTHLESPIALHEQNLDRFPDRNKRFIEQSLPKAQHFHSDFICCSCAKHESTVPCVPTFPPHTHTHSHKACPRSGDKTLEDNSLQLPCEIRPRSNTTIRLSSLNDSPLACSAILALCPSPVGGPRGLAAAH